jgi:hypothetical protein
LDSHFGFDEEYFALALAQLLTGLINRINEDHAKENLNRTKNFLFDAFIEMNTCTTMASFTQCIRTWATSLFGVTTAKVIFCENNQFVLFNSETEYIIEPFYNPIELSDTMLVLGSLVLHTRQKSLLSLLISRVLMYITIS